MDLVVLVATLASVFLALPVYLYLKNSKLSSIRGAPFSECFPGGRVYPLISAPGNTVAVFLSLFRQYGNVYSMWMGPTKAIVTSTPADIVQILTATDVFVRPQAMLSLFETATPGGLFSIPRKHHRVVRMKLRDSFNHSMLRSFHDALVDSVSELCHELHQIAVCETPTPTDISKQLSMATFRVITNVAFGFPLSREQRKSVSTHINDFVEELMAELINYPFRQMLTFTGVRQKFFNSRDKLLDTCKTFVNQRLQENAAKEEEKTKDVLDAIINLKDERPEAAVSNTMIFAVAGAHTSNEALVWSIFETCKNPDLLRSVHQELDDKFGNRPLSEPIESSEVSELPYVQALWKETLRVRPPGAFIMRTTTKEVTLKGSGVALPKGATLISLINGAHLNPDYWEDADSFDPSRWLPSAKHPEGFRPKPGAYLPFSVGPANCAGKFLADYEGVIILAEMHRRFEFKLACEIEDVRSFSSWVESARVGDDGLPVYISLRRNA